MAKRLEIYKCDLCGNVVEVLCEGGGTLVCCNEDMILLKENSEDATAEKHVPVITIDGEEKTIRVGSIPHPMEKEHYIEFIEAISSDGKYVKRKFLEPGEEPMLAYKCKCDKLYARELCNIHGLWRSKDD